MRRQNLFVVASALLVAAAVLPLTAFGQTPASKDVRYVPLDRAAFVQQNVVDGWINATPGPDLTSIYGHAWDLWRYLNKPSGQTLRGTPLPIWETWYSGEEVYLDNREVADPDSRDLDPPNQSLHSGALAVETGNASAKRTVARPASSAARTRQAAVLPIALHQRRDLRSHLQARSDPYDHRRRRPAR